MRRRTEPRGVRLEAFGTPELVSIWRNAVVDLATQVGYDPDVLALIELAASELITNAVCHGSDREPIQLDVDVLEDEIAITVTSGTESLVPPPIIEWETPPPHNRFGRGLAIVRRAAPFVAMENSHGIVQIRAAWPRGASGSS
jgi:anti-sigma regulatory factor (Ser/Thr protein kinase)